MPDLCFSRDGLLRGARASVPLLVGTTPFGIVVGVAAQGAGLSMAEAGLMSLTTCAGAAQLMALSHWAHPASLLQAAVATASVNSRLLLLGPVLAPFLSGVRGWRLWGSLGVMVDQNWAMSVAEMRAGRRDVGFLFGSGAVLWAWWTACTLIGFAAGAALRPPPDHPLYFAAVAVFLSLLVPMWRGRRDLLPWGVAACAALLVHRAFPGGSLHVVAGAVAGSAAALLQPDGPRAA